MKKINIIIILINLAILSYLLYLWNYNNVMTNTEIISSQKESQGITNVNKERDITEFDMKLSNISFNKIKSNSTLIKCEGKYDSSFGIFEEGGTSIGSIGENGEDFDLTINDDNLIMFGANFKILLNNDDSLIGIRLYEMSGLTELLHLNKNNGILIDSKTYTNWIGNAPATFNVVFSCY